MTRSKLSIAALLLPLFASCVTEQQYRALEEEVVDLREERTNLKKENRGLLAQIDALEASVSESDRMAAVDAGMNAPEIDEFDAQDIDYWTRHGDLVISVRSDITFASGQADLTAQGKQALQTVASVLRRDHPDATYWIEGHTDTDPIKVSKFASNRALSLARAMSVLHYLVEEAGISDSKCVVAGHGEYRPMAPNDNKSNKARNRRVEIVVHRDVPTQT